MGNVGGVDRLLKRHTNQVISAVTRRIDLYSASAEDKETNACFLDFHEMGAPPREMKKTLTNLRESQHEAQFTSQKTRRSKETSEGKRIS